MSETLLHTATAAAHAGGEILSRAFRSQGLEVERKGRHDYVTRVDRASEEAVVGTIREAHPGHAIVAEEGGGFAAEGARYRWLVDPLDGTTNFVRGVPFFAVSVACLEGDELVAAVVLDPLRGDLFAAARGRGATLGDRRLAISTRAGLDDAFLATGLPFRHAPEVRERYFEGFHRIFPRLAGLRRCGSAALDLAYVAAGVFDGFWEIGLASWDIAAGALLVREAGGVITDLEGGDGFLASGDVAAGPRGLHRELLAAVRDEALAEVHV